MSSIDATGPVDPKSLTQTIPLSGPADPSTLSTQGMYYTPSTPMPFAGMPTSSKMLNLGKQAVTGNFEQLLNWVTNYDMRGNIAAEQYLIQKAKGDHPTYPNIGKAYWEGTQGRGPQSTLDLWEQYAPILSKVYVPLPIPGGMPVTLPASIPLSLLTDFGSSFSTYLGFGSPVTAAKKIANLAQLGRYTKMKKS